MRRTNFSNLCCWCSSESETLEHLFFKCSLAQWAWKNIRQWWNVNISPQNLEDMWRMFSVLFTRSPIRKVWQLILTTTLWSIWLARNEKVFCNVQISEKSLIQVIKIRSSQWCLSIDWLETNQVNEWFLNPQRTFVQKFFKSQATFWSKCTTQRI